NVTKRLFDSLQEHDRSTATSLATGAQGGESNDPDAAKDVFAGSRRQAMRISRRTSPVPRVRQRRRRHTTGLATNYLVLSECPTERATHPREILHECLLREAMAKQSHNFSNSERRRHLSSKRATRNSPQLWFSRNGPLSKNPLRSRMRTP